MHPLTARIAGRRARRAVPLGPRSGVELRREPGNAHHRAAVLVLADGEVAGYLESGLAELVAPLLDRGRPVRATGREDGRSVDLFVPGLRQRIGRGLLEVPSSDGGRTYLVDRRTGVCTCPAGRHVLCRHKRALGLRPPAPPAAGMPGDG